MKVLVLIRFEYKRKFSVSLNCIFASLDKYGAKIFNFSMLAISLMFLDNLIATCSARKIISGKT
jgi:hypothetical protein